MRNGDPSRGLLLPGCGEPVADDAPAEERPQTARVKCASTLSLSRPDPELRLRRTRTGTPTPARAEPLPREGLRPLSSSERGFVATLTRCCAKNAAYAETCLG